MAKEIPLNLGYVALVSEEDYERVAQFRWRVMIRRKHPTWPIYAVRRIRVGEKGHRRRTLQLLHRFILGITDRKIQIDHKDHNGLNCQRDNIRVATPTQNQANQRPYRELGYKTSSAHRGVSFDKRRGKWVAVLHKKYIGQFNSEQAAADARNALAREIYGEFSHV